MKYSHKNIGSIKPKSASPETSNTHAPQGEKECNVYIKVYNIRETIFSDQTDQLPVRSQRGNKHIMVMVNIDRNGILVKPLNKGALWDSATD